MKICMMRHGEALDDIEDCYGGISDFPLTDTGREQAKATANLLKQHTPEIIYTSPLKRAKETAEIIANESSLAPPTIITNLQERNSYGVLSGVNKEKAKQVFDNVLSQLKEKPGYSKEAIPGCELWEDFVVRVSDVFDSIVKESQEKNYKSIGIVTHGKLTLALFDDLLDISEQVDMKHSSLNVIEYQPATVKFIK